MRPGRAVLLAVIALAVVAGLPLEAQDRPRRLFPPEELGVLEGPDRDAWQKPELVMDALGIGERSAVADVGAGGGWFTVRLARRVGPNGMVYAQDVQQQMLESISRRVVREGFSNVIYIRGERLDPKLPKAALDAVLMVDTYHEFENPVALLRGVGIARQAGRTRRHRQLPQRRWRTRAAVQRAREGRAGGRAGGGSGVAIARPGDVSRVSVFPDLRQVIRGLPDYAEDRSADSQLTL